MIFCFCFMSCVARIVNFFSRKPLFVNFIDQITGASWQLCSNALSFEWSDELRCVGRRCAMLSVWNDVLRELWSPETLRLCSEEKGHSSLLFYPIVILTFLSPCQCFVMQHPGSDEIVRNCFKDEYQSNLNCKSQAGTGFFRCCMGHLCNQNLTASSAAAHEDGNTSNKALISYWAKLLLIFLT